MLVANPCVNDSRVIRAAESISAEGHDVIVLAKKDGVAPTRETRNGVVYERYDIPRLKTIRQHMDALSVRAVSLVSRISSGIHAAYLRLRGGSHEESTPDDGAQKDKLLKKRYKYYSFRKGFYGRASSSYSNFNKKLIKSSRRITDKIISLLLRVLRFPEAIAKKHVRMVLSTYHNRMRFKTALLRLKPDIIHAHDLATLPVASDIARRTGAICIYDSHELEMHRNIKWGKLDRWLCHRLEDRHIRRTDAVITVCDSIADYLAKHYGIARPTVVMNAPSTEVVSKKTRQDIRSDLGLPEETPLALYVGSVTIGRGIDRIVRTLPLLPEFHLALLGPAHKPTLDAALEIAQAERISDRLHILPPVPPEEVVSYVRSADVSLVLIQNVCLSYYYCLPNKLVETTIAGLPVVVSDFPELRKFVERTGTGIATDETSIESIALAMREAYDRRETLRPDARRRDIIETLYGWETQRQKLIELYRKLLANEHLGKRARI